MGDMSALENAYVQSARGNGKSDEENRQYFRQNPSLVMQQSASSIMLTADADERTRFRRRAGMGAEMSLGTNTGYMQFMRGAQQTAAESIYGRGHGGAAQRDFARTMSADVRRASGEFGRTSQERDEAARAMQAIAMYRAVLEDPSQMNTEMGARARRQLAKLNVEIRQRFGAERGQDMINRANDPTASRAIRDNTEQYEMAKGFITAQGDRSASQVLTVIRQGQTRGDAARANEEMGLGANALAGRGGVLGDVFRNLQGEQFSETRLEDTLGNLSEDQVRRLREEGPLGRSLAAAIEQTKSTDTATRQRGMERIRTGLRRAGERGTEAFQRRREELHGPLGLLRGAMEGIGFSASTTRRVQESLASITGADRDADLFSDQSAAAEDRTRAEGIGGSNDAMLSAASELKQAAALLNSAVSNNQLRGILPE
jgi:hypothetical protein